MSYSHCRISGVVSTIAAVICPIPTVVFPGGHTKIALYNGKDITCRARKSLNGSRTRSISQAPVLGRNRSSSCRQELLFKQEQVIKYFVLIADLLLLKSPKVPKNTKNGTDQVLPLGLNAAPVEHYHMTVSCNL